MLKGVAVIGAGFGDEGKGLAVSNLCNVLIKQQPLNPVLVVRFSGGHQVGHTVNFKSKRHVFSNFGSGTLQQIPTLWMDSCTFDPVGWCNEFKHLESSFNIEPLLYLHKGAKVVTPFDINYNRKDLSNIKNGTVGVGFGSTLQRNEDYYRLIANDLQFKLITFNKLENIKRYYLGKLLSSDSIDIENYFDSIEFFKRKLQSKHVVLVDDDDIIKLCNTHRLIFEGNQGILLDQHHGFFPNVTRCNTTIKNIVSHPILSKYLERILLVTRAYSTRHGNGQFINSELISSFKENYPDIFDLTNQTHPYQGQFKMTYLIYEYLRYACSIHKIENIGKLPTDLLVTCTNQVIINGQIPIYDDGCIHKFSLREFVTKISTDNTNIDNIYFSYSDDAYEPFKLFLKTI